MKTTIKNLSTATSKNLGTKNAHQLDSKRLLLALTLCLSSSTSFNAAYCMDMDMEIETDGAYSPQRVAAGGNNDAFKMEDRDGQNIQILPDENQNAGIFEDPEFIKLWNGIKTADQKLQEQFDMQAREGLANGQVTILLGNSGVGKTALHKYLRGVPLVAKETDDFSLPFKIHSLHDEAPEEREIVIGTTYNAESTYPALRNGYFDCPGFEDTRGKVQKIINAYSIKKVFEHVTDFRLLLVASSSQFANRGNEFLKLIGNLGEMFNEDLSILRALNIVVTKSDPIANNMERLKATLRGILRENESISPFQRKVLEFMSAVENQQITFFNRPMAAGLISPDMTLINGTISLANEHKITPKMIIPYDAIGYIAGLREKLSVEILKTLDSFHAELQNGVLVENFIASQNKTAKELREDFSNLVTLLNEEPQKYKKIQRVLHNFSSNKAETFSSLMTMRKFIRDIDESFHIDLDRKKLSELATYFEPFAEDIDEPEHSDNKLIFSGNIIGLSDVLQKIDKYPAVQQLEIYGLNTILIDSDIYLPSTNVIFDTSCLNVVPNQYSVQPRIISLRGKDGSPESGGRAYCGGSAFVKFDKISHGENLTIDLSGGEGGIPRNWEWNIKKGTYVVHGKDAKDGTPGSREEILRMPSHCFVSNTPEGQLYRSGTFSGNNEDILYKNRQKPGENVYTTYNGPKGGKPGSITFCSEKNNYYKDHYVSNKDHEIDITIRSGIDGPSAEGIPGLGGLNGTPIYEGIFVSGRLYGGTWKNGDPQQVPYPERGPKGMKLPGTVPGLEPIKILTLTRQNENVGDHNPRPLKIKTNADNSKTKKRKNEENDKNPTPKKKKK